MRVTVSVDFNEEGLKELKALYKAMEKTLSSDEPADERKKPDNDIEVVSGRPINEKINIRGPISDEPAKPAISKTEVRAAALKISKAGKADILRKIFADFGADNLKGIPEDKYAELMKRLVEVNV